MNLYFGPQNFSDKLQNNASADGNPVILKGSVSGTLWDYSTTDAISLHTAGNDGNGFATVSAVGGVGFSDLTLTPELGMFRAIGFNVFPLVPNNASPNALIYGDITVYIDGLAPVIFNDVAFGKNGNKFWINSDSGLNFTKLVFSGLMYDAPLKNGVDPAAVAAKYESMRQVSVEMAPKPVGAVPEPSTWAMMMVGFAVVGSAMRRRRTRIAFA